MVRPDGGPYSQADLAKKAGLSEETIWRAENGRRISNDSRQRIISALDPDGTKRSILEDAFNPLRTERSTLDDGDRDKIRKRLRRYMRLPLPAFIMDEYWFMRVMNIQVLALHGIERRMLYKPVTWHVIAMKFYPEIGMKEKRGPDWRDYYLVAVMDFRRKVMDLGGTLRYEKLMQWLKSLKGFAHFWKEAELGELEYEIRARTTESIPVRVGNKIQHWREFGLNALIYPRLSDYWVSLWLPPTETEEEMFEFLRNAKFLDVAEGLGYDPKQPLVFMEDYLHEDEMKRIGAWLV